MFWINEITSLILLCFRDVCQNQDVLLSNFVEVFYNVLDIRHYISTDI